VDFAGLARAAGFGSVSQFDQLDACRRAARDVLAQPGPRFVALAVEPVADWELTSPGPMSERLARFQAALAAI
jgi:hypothetical protein